VTKQIVAEAKEAASRELDQVMALLAVAREEAEALPESGTKKLLALKKVSKLESRALISESHLTMERLLREVQGGALERDAQGWLEGLVEGDAAGMRALSKVAQLTHGAEDSKGEAAAGMLLSVLESIAAKPRLLGAAVRAGALEALESMVRRGGAQPRVTEAVGLLEEAILGR